MNAELEVKYNIYMQLDGNWRLQVWTSKAEGITPKIFVWQALNIVPYDTSPRGIFVNIAQPSDIEEYPEDTPGDMTNFYRREYMDVVIKDSELAYHSLESINNDVDQLCKAYRQL